MTMELAVIIIGAILGMAMTLAILYVQWFILFPMLWRMNRETFRRIRERKKSS